MSIESFNKVIFSNASKFTNEDGKIALRQYSDDLVLYSSFDSTQNATFAKCNIYPLIEGNTEICDSGVFAQYVKLNSASITYNSINFDTFTDQGCVKFRISPKFNNGYGQQYFKATSVEELNSIPSISKKKYKFGGGSLNLTGNSRKYIKYSSQNISSLAQKGSINFFVSFDYLNAPTSDLTFFDIKNSTDNTNRIVLTHNTDGKIYLKIYDQTADEKINISFDYLPQDHDFHYIEVNFDLNEGITQVFLDGVQYGTASLITATRTLNNEDLYLGNISDFYIDDFAIFTEPQHDNNFIPRDLALEGNEENLIIYASYNTSTSLLTGEEKNPLDVYPSNSEYAFDLYIDEIFNKTVLINIEENDTLQIISGKIDAQLEPANPDNREAYSEYNGRIKIRARNKGAKIEIKENTNYGNLVNLLGGVENPLLPNGPEEDTIIFSAKDIEIIHTRNSEIVLKFYENEVLKVNENLGIWNNEYNEWYAFELDFNKAIYQFFIDGNLISVGKTGFSRKFNDNYIRISSGNSIYGFDELIVYDVPHNFSDYEVETRSLTPYPTDDPYIDVEFGKGFTENQITGLDIIGSSGLSFTVKIGDTPYYYFNGAWRISDNSYSQSSSLAITEANFNTLYFDPENEITFRVFFDSDGFTPQWLDKIEILQDTNGLYPASIIGTQDLTNPVDLSENYLITIITDQGSDTVDLRSAAEDPTNVSMDEIKQAIDEAQIPGLDQAMDDGHGHLLLQTTTLGDDAYIAVQSPLTNNAVPIVWGEDSESSGEVDDKVFMDYSGLEDIIVKRLGSPTVPVELTKDQLDICVDQAIYWYNYYRNSRENRVIVELKGNDKDGYEIPKCVGSQDNILDIVFRPVFPFSYYMNLSASGDSFFANVFLQTFFQNSSAFSDFLSDFYTMSSAVKDVANILGKNQVWYIYNNKIFINPKVHGHARVGIIYRSSLSADELLNNIHVQDLAYAFALQILGTIRSTYGGTIPVGSENLTMPGESLIERGKTYFEEKKKELQSLEEPLFLSWF